MHKLSKLQLVCTLLIGLFCSIHASAFSVSNYATQSKLASGKWVKISIPESGMYEITYDELREMGFNNPSQVRVYGHGGYKISEILSGRNIDDLKPVRVLRTNDKICFYGNGPIKFSMTGNNSTPRFTREFNPYSQVGCYFLTEEGTSDIPMPRMTKTTYENYIDTPTSLSFFYHEKEMASISGSGKEMLGEDFSGTPLLIDYYLPGLADSTIVVNTVIAANASVITYANAVIRSGEATDTTSYTVSSSRIYVPSGSTVYYNYASPYAFLKLSDPAEHGQFEPMLIFSSDDFKLTLARLDYFILTYKRNNVISEDEDNQLLMGYSGVKGNERFLLPNASPSTAVWYINDTNNPLDVSLDAYDDESGQGKCFFHSTASYAYFVAFDPAKTLKKISSFEPVANQNLHGMPTPDLLIITAKAFRDQAERVADLHRAVDGIDVVVADQDQVFNEFSSGTRDAMAYRLACKMFFDRDQSKFKNLLLMGTGSMDNRELLGEHGNSLLTYQTDNSNYEDFSYTSDDFFAMLTDNSGASLSAEKLSIGVGRMTCNDPDEARTDVDKLVEYYANPDYGVWRNNTMAFSDSPDLGKYMFQAEGYKNQIDNELQTGMHVTTVHNSQYPRSNTQPNRPFERKTANVAKQLLSECFKSGMYFATYVGHAGSVGFTKYNSMWVTSDVANTSYRHFPIMSTACCNVAHFDGDSRGIAELMFHKRDGGAIALLASTRMVYGDNNDKLNKFFINGLFSNAQYGVMPTLGEAYKYSKNSFTTAETNKMKFFLLGDPAIKVNYPISLFNITKVNSTDMTDTINAEISPLMKFAIEAQVVDEDGNLDSSFNGDATATLYDKEELFTTLAFTFNGQRTERDIYFNRPKLAEINGRVVNGVFQGEMIAPDLPAANNDTVLLRVYAHKDNTDRMVNGFTKQITMLPYDESLAISDEEAPIINAMYINDEATFTNGAIVAPTAMLYINVSDNEGISLQSNSVDKRMRLVLDSGKPSYADVSCFAVVDDGGHMVNIEYPLSNLTEGMHTLTYTVYDIVGNSATYTISFMVGQNSASNLVADKLPAYLDGEVNFGLDTDLSQSPEYIVRVTDATGKLVWMTTTSSFPVTWNMRDMQGNQVPAGLYRYFGTYNDGVNYGGTPINKLIVLDPVKTTSK